MNIKNERFLKTEKNIFTLRKMEESKLLETVRQIVNPVEEFGFKINVIDLKNKRTTQGELSQSIKQNLVIKLEKGGHPRFKHNNS